MSDNLVGQILGINSNTAGLAGDQYNPYYNPYLNTPPSWVPMQPPPPTITMLPTTYNNTYADHPPKSIVLDPWYSKACGWIHAIVSWFGARFWLYCEKSHHWAIFQRTYNVLTYWTVDGLKHEEKKRWCRACWVKESLVQK